MRNVLIIGLLFLMAFTKPPVGTKTVIIGDSTIAAYLGQSAIADSLLQPSYRFFSHSVVSLAIPGQTTTQQQTEWFNYSGKATTDNVFIQVGLNDFTYTQSVAAIMATYQHLVDTVRATMKPGGKIIVATMAPVKQRLINLYGSTNGAISYQIWLDMNTAIMGNGPYAITGVDARVSEHTDLLNDGSGNLNPIYEISGVVDGVHENNVARGIIASVWRRTLERIGAISTIIHGKRVVLQ